MPASETSFIKFEINSRGQLFTIWATSILPEQALAIASQVSADKEPALLDILGMGLLKFSQELIIEKGTDSFFRISFPRKFLLGCDNLAIELAPAKQPFGICLFRPDTQPTEIFGRPDVVFVQAKSSNLAHVTAAAIANEINQPSDIDHALKTAKRTKGLLGVFIKKGAQTGILGNLNLISA